MSFYTACCHLEYFSSSTCTLSSLSVRLPNTSSSIPHFLNCPGAACSHPYLVALAPGSQLVPMSSQTRDSTLFLPVTGSSRRSLPGASLLGGESTLRCPPVLPESAASWRKGSSRTQPQSPSSVWLACFHSSLCKDFS